MVASQRSSWEANAMNKAGKAPLGDPIDMVIVGLVVSRSEGARNQLRIHILAVLVMRQKNRAERRKITIWAASKHLTDIPLIREIYFPWLGPINNDRNEEMSLAVSISAQQKQVWKGRQQNLK
jgi:hypothetical protein